MSLRTRILSCAYRLSPFSLKGDALLEHNEESCDVSCVINFFGRIDLLESILFSLAEQDLPKERYEVILVEDRGGTKEGREVAQHFASLFNARYFALPENHGIMGYSRNYGLSRTTGKYVLFLDDDTVILQRDFLSKLVESFRKTNAEGIIPHGNASYCLVEGRYDHHDAFFPTSRCMAYQRKVLQELGGFVSSMIGQEDVEFYVRYLLSGKSSISDSHIKYFHPPLLVPNFRKPMAVGNSFYHLRRRYPIVPWLLLLANCSRHAPLYLVPLKRYREMGRFGLGFIFGVIASPFKREGFQYG